jgi:hypothetical protein
VEGRAASPDRPNKFFAVHASMIIPQEAWRWARLEEKFNVDGGAGWDEGMNLDLGDELCVRSSVPGQRLLKWALV